MDIRLSWDLFVLVLFIVIVAYSFIIGRDNTLKVILGTYVSAIAADAVGNLFDTYLNGSALFMQILNMASVNNEQEAMILVKVLVFVGFVIMFAVRGAFEVRTSDDRSGVVRIVLLSIYAVMSAGLIISIILVFVSGVSLVGGGNLDTTDNALRSISDKSQIIRLLLNNAYLIFSLPALTFIAHSLYTKE